MRQWFVRSAMVASIALSSTLLVLPVSSRPDQVERLSPALVSLQQELATYRAQPSAAPFQPRNQALPLRAGEAVLVDVLTQSDADPVMAQLHDLGMRHANTNGHLISGHLPISQLQAASQIAGVRFIRPAYYQQHKGATTSQADLSMRVVEARQLSGLDGSGIKVGVLSDSYDCTTSDATNAADDIASGDLPAAGVQVLRDFNQAGCIDEGRAMLQLVHDLVPGADLAYYTAFEGQAGFAEGIIALADAGSDVIVDDIIYFAEPMFQDGIVAQAAQQVVDRGIPYFSSAGNMGPVSYESPFRAAPTVDIGGVSYTPHDFDPGPEVADRLRLFLPPFDSAQLVLQWDEPFLSVNNASGGAQSDLDLLVINPPSDVGVQSEIINNLGQDPLEIPTIFSQVAENRIVEIMVAVPSTSPKMPSYFKIIPFGGGRLDPALANQGTIYGHAGAAGAVAVGAAAFFATPAFGTTPPLIEDFSSSGPVQIFFTPQGERLPEAQTRAKPEIVATDGTNTTFFGNDVLQDDDVFPNFFGTSAAAPHAAAVAALMLQAKPSTTPAQITALMQASAIDMGDAGFDSLTGAGLVQADAAIAPLLGGSNVTDLQLSADQTGFALRPNTAFIVGLNVTNVGTVASGALTLTMNLAPGLGITAFDQTEWTCAVIEGALTCTRPELGAGETSRFSLSLSTPSELNPYPFSAQVVLSPTVTDPQLANNRVEGVVLVSQPFFLPMILSAN